MLRLGCYLRVGRAGGNERDGLRQGSNLTPPPTPSPGPGREGPRRVRASKMAQDGSRCPKLASKTVQESPRWLKTASKMPPSRGRAGEAPERAGSLLARQGGGSTQLLNTTPNSQQYPSPTQHPILNSTRFQHSTQYSTASRCKRESLEIPPALWATGGLTMSFFPLPEAPSGAP